MRLLWCILVRLLTKIKQKGKNPHCAYHDNGMRMERTTKKKDSHHVLESGVRRDRFLSTHEVCPINAEDTTGNVVVKQRPVLLIWCPQTARVLT